MTTIRAAAHVHSEWSDDASWTLLDIARAFTRRRYDAVLMCEHDRGFSAEKWDDYRQACAAASAGGITLIPGIEYQDGDNLVHTPVWGVDVPFLGESRPTLELLRAARDHDAVAVFAHPWRRNAIERYSPEWAPLLSAIEIWNRKYDGIAPRRGALEFARHEDLPPFVTLDFHTRRQFFPLAMTMDIDGPISEPALVDAISAGRCTPQAFGLSALRFTYGLEGLAARALEEVRHELARRLRAIQSRRSSRPE